MIGKIAPFNEEKKRKKSVETLIQKKQKKINYKLYTQRFTEKNKTEESESVFYSILLVDQDFLKYVC